MITFSPSQRSSCLPRLLPLLLLLLPLLFYPPAHANTVSFAELRKEKESGVTHLARVIRLAFTLQHWCTSGDTCNNTSSCAHHDCSGDIGSGAKCQYDIIANCDCKQPKYDNQCPVKRLNDASCAGIDSPLSSPSGGHKGQLLNFEQPTFRTPKGSITSTGDGAPIIVNDAFIRRDVCSLKQGAAELRSLYKDSNLTAWMYAGTEYGAFMIYPGHAQCRGSGGLTSCDYNPTERPWYITAATGYRDIVFLYDRNLARTSVLARAFAETLYTTDERDAVAVLGFDHTDDTVDWLADDGNQFTLLHANDMAKRAVIGNLPTTGISKASNIRPALRDAFRTLRDTSVSASCNRFIVIMLGSDDTCFSSCVSSLSPASSGDSSQSSAANGAATCTCMQDILRYVERQQRLFTDGRGATLVTFTERALRRTSSNSDSASAQAVAVATARMEGLASTLACSTKEGLWHGVTEDDTANTAMNAFTHVSSLLQFNTQEEPSIFGTDVYQDSDGLGSMFTLSAPVYDFNGRRLVAVVGVDILLTEVVERTGLSEDRAIAEIRAYNRETRECDKDAVLDLCDAQALRVNQRNSQVCPAPPAAHVRTWTKRNDGADDSQTNACYLYASSSYAVPPTAMSFSAAQQHCVDRGGSLVIVDDVEENQALTMLVATDGSWLGLSGSATGTWRWVNGSDAVLRGDEFAVPYPDGGGSGVDERDCVAADRRSVSRNWVIEPCASARPFVCKFADEAACRRSFAPPSTTATGDDGGGIPTTPPTTAEVVPIEDLRTQCPDSIRVDARICGNVSDAIDSADPFCKQTGPNYSEADRLCCGGRADPDTDPPGVEKINFVVDVGTVVGAVLGLLFAVTLVAGLVVFGRARSRRQRMANESANAVTGGEGGPALNGGPGPAESEYLKNGEDDQRCAPGQPTKTGSSETFPSTRAVWPDITSNKPGKGTPFAEHRKPRSSNETNTTTDFGC